MKESCSSTVDSMPAHTGTKWLLRYPSLDIGLLPLICQAAA